MPDLHDHFANARNYASDLLRKMPQKTAEKIEKVARIAAENEERTAVLLGSPVKVDIGMLTSALMHLFSVQAGDVTILDDHDPKEHAAWLPNKRSQIQWRFWNRYVTYLERDFGMAPDVVNSLHELTDKILERLEDPQRAGKWDRRGMVVGSVQSGKTANYVGLINKAIDAGYKLVIILAGIHSNLRAQTQLRVDEGVLGFDTQKNRRLNMNGRWIGVGRLPGEKLIVHSLTSSSEKGDFSKPVAESIGVMIGGDPVVLVVKKNSKLLGNLMKWVRAVAGSEDSDSKVIPNTPLLLIDDEADNASINIKDSRDAEGNADSVSAINGAIREILFSFEKSAYVGYTATPFANIFINPSAQTEKHGEDIFPRSFIINVKAPSNYIGPAKVFGLDGDVDAGVPAQDGLPIVRDLHGAAFNADYMDDEAFPQPHKIDHVPTVLPSSLKEAVRCFILGCAARRARGQERKHNSMLVHVTRFKDVQEHASRLLRDELMALQKRIEHGDGARRPTVREELRALWEREFVPVSQALGTEAGALMTWEQVDAELHAAAAKIDVLTVNASAGTPLDYKEHEAEGRSVIAVGGNKLSRGLTLEGLSISYFLRTSKMYDTLMQMGRWFGYRPGYLDLCRLFTTRTLIGWYRHIALAEAELRREFDYMVAARLTPLDYGLRVRTHPEGMVVTAMNKMCHSQKLELSWAGVLVQTTQLPKDERIAVNLAATEALLAPLGAPAAGAERETRIWRGVRAAMVARFVEALRFPPEAARASGPQLAEFIRKQTGKVPMELTTWTVALVSNSQAAECERRMIAGQSVGLIERTPESQSGGNFSLIKGNILSPADEARDFRGVPFDAAWFAAISAKPELWDDMGWLQEQVGRDATAVALGLTLRWQESAPPKLKPPVKGATKRPNGRVLRVLRRRDHALLLIYPILPPEIVPARDGRPQERTGLAASGDAIIGVALSFPASHTALGVEYRVGKVWLQTMREDAEYDD
jgi:hypothetical protein